MIDQELIYRKFKLISKDLKSLRQISNLSEREYFKDPVWEIQTERYLERIIGRMIDVNYHIVSEVSGSSPSDYYESFIGLAEIRILPGDFSEIIASFAGIRNRLVHEYNNLDKKKIHEAISKVIKNVPRYFQYIEDWFDKNKE
jgi:uncharacterized protein YutE (UPF0331/DUF86 family)